MSVCSALSRCQFDGDLANWHTGAPDAIPAVGGAMDLAMGAKDVFVLMTLFSKDGRPSWSPTCTYPLTGCAVSAASTPIRHLRHRPRG